jgi:hypothetical protein
MRDDWSEYPGRRDAKQDHAPDGEQGSEPAPAAAAPGGLGDGPGGLGDGPGGLGDGPGGLGDGPGGPDDGPGGLGDGRYPRLSDGPNRRDGLGFRIVDQAQPGRFGHGGRLPGGRARPEWIRY